MSTADSSKCGGVGGCVGGCVCVKIQKMKTKVFLPELGK